MAPACFPGIDTRGGAVRSVLVAGHLAVVADGAKSRVALRHAGEGLCRYGRRGRGNRT